jgi:hypothetical protein
MITISFLEEIDGEPTPTPQNDMVLTARQTQGYIARGCNELGPADPRYFMPQDALQPRLAVNEGIVPNARKQAPAFTVIVNGRLLDDMDDDGRVPRFATHPWAA